MTFTTVNPATLIFLLMLLTGQPLHSAMPADYQIEADLPSVAQINTAACSTAYAIVFHKAPNTYTMVCAAVTAGTISTLDVQQGDRSHFKLQGTPTDLARYFALLYPGMQIYLAQTGAHNAYWEVWHDNETNGTQYPTSDCGSNYFLTIHRVWQGGKADCTIKGMSASKLEELIEAKLREWGIAKDAETIEQFDDAMNEILMKWANTR